MNTCYRWRKRPASQLVGGAGTQMPWFLCALLLGVTRVPILFHQQSAVVGDSGSACNRWRFWRLWLAVLQTISHMLVLLLCTLCSLLLDRRVEGEIALFQANLWQWRSGPRVCPDWLSTFLIKQWFQWFVFCFESRGSKTPICLQLRNHWRWNTAERQVSGKRYLLVLFGFPAICHTFTHYIID